MCSQRHLVDSYRDRAVTAEREQQVARVAQARAAERTRIAREMHDVLAHRISLVAMHAGTLSYRTDLSDDERAATARSIEDNAQRALQRPAGGPRGAARPHPARGRHPRAAAARHRRHRRTGGGGARRAGCAYDSRTGSRTRCRPHGADGLPDRAGGADQRAQARARDVRDGRPRRHAGRRPRRSPCATRLRWGRSYDASLPASGLGLIGLAERAALAGGRISHGADATGGYSVRAWIPWTP